MNPLPKSPLIGEARDREILSSATSYRYYQSEQGDLDAHFFFPHDFNRESDQRPAILFFHGGLWDISAPTQFVPHCHHFASRGMVAISVAYRTRALLDGGPEDAIEDARQMMLFLAEHGASLGIDLDNIVVVGASAGANAALHTVITPKLRKGETPLFPQPAATILFGPISDTTPKGIGNGLFANPRAGKLLSPYHLLPRKGLPPCLIFHGTKDRVVPFEQSVKFAKRYRRRRNSCELMEFENAGHTFFNYNSDERNYELTLRASDHFLVECGILQPDPCADLL